MRTGFLLAVALISAIIFLPVSSGAEGWYSVQVGALGDTPANGSAGIRVQIQTISYPVHKPDLSDSFWVGNTLTDGAFIQFGYQIEPGYFCLRGQVANGTNTCSGGAGLVGESDARWFWQYWPDAKGPDYYYAKGPAGSVGSSGEWHTYAIVPNHENGWNFELDGVHVDSLHAEWSLLNSPPYVVAEKLTYSAQPGSLGPVQFRQLQYLQQEDKGSMVWKNDNLIALIHGCGEGTRCLSNSEYQATLESPNILVVGSRSFLTPYDDLTEGLTSEIFWFQALVIALLIPATISLVITLIRQNHTERLGKFSSKAA